LPYISFNNHIVLVYKTIDRLIQARPGRPMKITGRQARPRKTNGRHRQAEDLRSLSWAGQAYFWRPAWTSGKHPFQRK